MNEHLIADSQRKSDARNAGAEQGYTTSQPYQHTAHCGVERRNCGLDTGARGWRYVYQTH